ncbi:TPA: outer membrane beta-barrel protein [Legionella bozemanae]|uniref:outer membrane protein n=1 Tax=Legionella bozemanae TaxID=447 RepID=UPI0010412576|nr:outer membrane beta-barrel protein [Legionella bozemanae]
MRQIIKFGFILGLMASSNAFSSDPVEGLYLNLLGQISHASSPDINFTINNVASLGSIQLGPVGGGMGTALGYKIKNFRVEGEFLFNINNYGSLKSGSCTLISPKVLGPEGVCPDTFVQTGLGFNGNVIGLYGLVNAYYDFQFTNDSGDNSNFVPYLGAGFGGAMIRHHASFQSNNQCITLGTCAPIINESFNTSNTGFAAQGIVGFYYYLDDFTTLGLDFRYVSTLNFNKNNTSSNAVDDTFGISTINITANFALTKAD